MMMENGEWTVRRCRVSRWDETFVYGETDEGSVRLSGEAVAAARPLLRTGMLINIIERREERGERRENSVSADYCQAEPKDACVELQPALVVVEPDFLMDVTAVASCFARPGMHPLSYTLKRLEPRANSQAILLGNFAGAALDDIIEERGRRRSALPLCSAKNEEGGEREELKYDVTETLWRSFREQAMQFCACEDFDGERFISDARQQAANLEEVVGELFGRGERREGFERGERREERGERIDKRDEEGGELKNGKIEELKYDVGRALLEPSFVCEALGLQGRVDLMTDDLRLLVEQKSGRNHRIEQQAAIVHRTDHFVQLLLYYGILRMNFQQHHDAIDIRLLYSKYPAREGLLRVDYQPRLLRRAIEMRNLLVAWELHFASEGAQALLPLLPKMGDAERDYFLRMARFVYREQLCSRLHARPGQYAICDLWRMPLEEKLRTGNIYAQCSLNNKRREERGERRENTLEGKGILTLEIPQDTPDYVRNFRRGDGVYVYHYDDVPDVRHHILYKGTLEEIREDRLVVRLMGQRPMDCGLQPIDNGKLIIDNSRGTRNEALGSAALLCKEGGTRSEEYWAVEHGSSDNATGNYLRSIYELVSSDDERRRQLLLGLRAPEADTSLRLSRSYHPDYDDILLKAKQARDYFLLVGPPGTGKTSMALRYLVEEELCSMDNGQWTMDNERGESAKQILLTAYTNRAVDEICEMLTEAGIDFLRLGNETSCDPRFAGHLLEQRLGERPKLVEMQRLIREMPVVVSTTMMLQSRPFIFALKHFSLCIVDEASQLLEPAIVGILARGPMDNGQWTMDNSRGTRRSALPLCSAKNEESGGIDRFILIGDHKQLPAVVQQENGGDCARSLFERLLRQEREAGRTQFVGVLHKQGRMHPDVAAFTNELFYRQEQITPVPLPHQQADSLGYDEPSVDALDDLLKRERVIFFDAHGASENVKIEKLKNVKIDGTAGFIADLVRRIHRFYGERFDVQKTVGVIVPYRIEIGRIRKEIERMGIPELRDISIDTVERYQGSQRDVIIYDFAVSDDSQLEFLTATCFEEGGTVIDRKLNVAMTRARKQLLMTGNAGILRRNKIFDALIARYTKNYS